MFLIPLVIATLIIWLLRQASGLPRHTFVAKDLGKKHGVAVPALPHHHLLLCLTPAASASSLSAISLSAAAATRPASPPPASPPASAPPPQSLFFSLIRRDSSSPPASSPLPASPPHASPPPSSQSSPVSPPPASPPPSASLHCQLLIAVPFRPRVERVRKDPLCPLLPPTFGGGAHR